MNKVCYQINLQQGFGGGEVYAGFFSKALMSLGWQSVLVVRRGSVLAGSAAQIAHQVIAVDRPEEIPVLLPDSRVLVVCHTPLPARMADSIRKLHFLINFAHMPLYGRDPEPFRHCDLVFAVSRHVIDSIRAAGISHVYPEPLYGVASLDRSNDDEGPIVAGSIYDWDKRKVRDRLLSLVYPLYLHLKPHRVFKKLPGLTLGIVSRLTPIKQFPLLFTLLAPILNKHPTVHLEIFGSGGYASVRDLRRALRPVAGQIRFWGHQQDVRSVYSQLDYLMTGLPEKEALGLNIIEAQACGTPILAVDAPPFIETVLHEQTGFLYPDPRMDQGEGFGHLLERLLTEPRPNPLNHPEHLQRFSAAAYQTRLGIITNNIRKAD